MVLARFFVTFVPFVCMASIVACEASHTAKKASDKAATADGKQIIAEGNEKLSKAMALQAELHKEYSIVLQEVRDQQGRAVKTSVLAIDYQWRILTKEQRRSAKEKLAQYLALSSEILELDARKGFYVTNKDQVTAARDAAYSFQKSLENFEKMVGENFEPKPGSMPAAPYSRSIEV
ncbi:MAG: hypothetical protein KF799_03075 [Bdellovibrionales bacterium]|nr:hypothetical protein [Bdellovibrionales bacterium]